MKKQIEQVLSGKIKYEQPQLLFSQEKITVTVKSGESMQGEIYFGTENNDRIRGYLTSSNRRLVLGNSSFSGTTIRLPYGVDGVGMDPGEVIKGWICVSSNVGEYKLPFEICTEKERVESYSGEIRDLDSFVKLAKSDFKEAYRIFTGKSFPLIMADASPKQKALYEAMSAAPVTYQNLEEFLIGMGAKEAVSLYVDEEKSEHFGIKENVLESIELKRSGWGHLRLEIETIGEFLEPERHVLSDEDFIGSVCHVNYVIRADKLTQSNHRGAITIRSPYQELTCIVQASAGAKKLPDASHAIHRWQVEYIREYIKYREAKTDFTSWLGKGREVLEVFKVSHGKTPEYLALKSYIEHLEGKNKRDGKNTSDILFEMEDLFDKGCVSPILYLEAWKIIESDVSKLHRLSPFWIQVFCFAGREKLFNEELLMRLAYLSGYEKQFTGSLYLALTNGYRQLPSDEVLEAICKYIMKGNPRKPEYFEWYDLAVSHGLRLTRLYEYYIETMDISYRRELPKPVLMYFAYNDSSLGDARRAYVYACVIDNKEKDPQTYANYKDTIAAFAKRVISDGRMNENYAVIYQDVLFDPQTAEEAAVIAPQLFTYRLYCGNSRMRQVIVRHSQLEKEEIYTLSQGTVYLRLYTDDAVIVFKDEQQRRYADTIPYNLKKLTSETSTAEKLVVLESKDPGVLLHYCETHEPATENLEYYQMFSESPYCAKDYRDQLRRKIVDHYAANAGEYKLEEKLNSLDLREYAKIDKGALLTTLIEHRMFRQAFAVISEYGYEGVELTAVLKLTSRMILKSNMAEDEELIALASEVYRAGKYDEVILHYLMQYRFGPMDELLSIWKSAKGFEMDTYEMEEKLLLLLIFELDYRKDGEEILKSYVRQSGKERVIGAYLTMAAYGSFVHGYPMSRFICERLENACSQKWPLNRVVRFALLQDISKEKNQQRYFSLESSILAECAKDDMTFGFYRKLPAQLLSPYQWDDKTFVECHANPKARVTLYYMLDTGLASENEYKSEPVRMVYPGIFVRTFTLFYGENLKYYFRIEEDGSERKTAERTVTMRKVEGVPGTKYQLLNQMLSARRLGKEKEVADSLGKYLRQEQYVKEMFTIDKENKE